MGECGCTSNDTRLKFPGPGKSFYILTLTAGCIECSGPPGVSIERHEPGGHGYEYYSDEAYYDGPLKFEKWSDCDGGAAIITGMLREEFIKALKKHLIGIDSSEFGENGKIDEIGAETLLEEVYKDSVMRPKLVEYKD